MPETVLPDRFHPVGDPFVEIERRDLSRLVRDELLLLPEKYRSPVVLCYIEGRTHAEAARQLGYPAGSLSRRLKRAGALLRRRLIERGFSLAIGLLVMGFAVFSVWTVCRDRGPTCAIGSIGDVVVQAARLRGDGNGALDRADRTIWRGLRCGADRGVCPCRDSGG